MSSDWFALNSAAARRARGGRRTQASRDVGDHLLHPAGEQLVLLLGAEARARPTARSSRSRPTAWPSWRRPGAVEHFARRLRRRRSRELLGIRALELLGVVAQQPLADQLQQDVVVALERDVDVEVGAEADEAVLEEEARAAAGLARLLQGVERVPGRQRLEGRREGLEVFAVGIRVGLAAEDGVELLQELVVGEDRRVRRRQPGEQAALVLAVVEQHDLVGAGARVELATLVRVGDRDVEADGRGPRRGAVERHAALHEGSEHREEAAARAEMWLE